MQTISCSTCGQEMAWLSPGPIARLLEHNAMVHGRLARASEPVTAHPPRRVHQGARLLEHFRTHPMPRPYRAGEVLRLADKYRLSEEYVRTLMSAHGVPYRSSPF